MEQSNSNVVSFGLVFAFTLRLNWFCDRSRSGERWLGEPPKDLIDRQVDAILAFLRALTEPDSVDLRTDVPKSVPSGLSIVE